MKRSRTPRRDVHAPENDLPLFCDFSCRHASFAPVETSGACRRDLAVYCTLLSRYNNKHARCLAREPD